MLRFLNLRFEEILGSLLLGVMVTIAFVNVVVRYLTSFSFAWTEELTINFFVWITMLGIARAYRTGQHLAMAVFYNLFPLAGKKFCNAISAALCLFFFGALAYTGTLEVIDEWELESISESLGVPVWWYTIATPLFSLLIIFRMLQHSYDLWIKGDF